VLRQFAGLAAGMLLTVSVVAGAGAPSYRDRFVWVFGWNLSKDADVADVSRLIETAAGHGINGAIVSFGLDTLCKKTDDYFRRLEQIKQCCEKNSVELIPAVFSVGYGGGVLAHDRNLAEGMPVEGALFVVKGNEAHFQPEQTQVLANGGFEDFAGHKLRSFSFHDQPGTVSFVDTEVRHSGRASLRMENFTANPHGHGRVMQQVRVMPRRCYRMTLWVRTEDLRPAGAFRAIALAGKDRNLAPRTFNVPTTTDGWRKLTTVFNSGPYDTVRLYAGVWGGRGGRYWLDDWTVEEVGPLNVLRRPGTPVTVRSEDGTVTYAEGTDYAPLTDPSFNFYNVDRPWPALRLTAGSRIRDGQKMRVSWYHPMVINESQITVCMAEPALYEIYDHEAALLAKHLRPRRVMLNMDEVRMGGTCAACRGRDMAELLGKCVTRQAEIIRRHIPGAEIYVWSDMFDPNHNARGEYYLVEGDYTGSWKHVPRDLKIAVWGGAPRQKSLKFFADQGFEILVACYYDAADLNEVKGWLEAARGMTCVRGFMYTPWQRKYELLPAFGDMILNARP